MTSTQTKKRLTGSALLSWIPRAVLALAIGGGGIMKLTGDASMVDMFDTIGAGQWLRYLVGALEVAGAVGLLLPVLVFPAAGGLAALLIGAAVTNVVALDIPPVLPLAYLVVAVAIAVLHRPSWLRSRATVTATPSRTPVTRPRLEDTAS